MLVVYFVLKRIASDTQNPEQYIEHQVTRFILLGLVILLSPAACLAVPIACTRPVYSPVYKIISHSDHPASVRQIFHIVLIAAAADSLD